jgi:hypothetical protein
MDSVRPSTRTFGAAQDEVVFFARSIIVLILSHARLARESKDAG